MQILKMSHCYPVMEITMVTNARLQVWYLYLWKIGSNSWRDSKRPISHFIVLTN